MKWWIVFHIAVITIILLVAFSPLFGVMYAGAVAQANGCTLDEGSVHPCIVNGVDQGDSLYTLGVMGWLMMVTIPVGVLLAGAYIVLVLVIFFIRRYLAKKGSKKSSPLNSFIEGQSD
jgi:hypothetical protein